MQKKGTLVISLDFELLWGVRDKKNIESYGKDIEAVKEVIPRLLHLFEIYNIRATFSTVGFLFASSKKELELSTPYSTPSYLNKNLSPYNGHFSLVRENAAEDPYHYAPELIDMIKKRKLHHIGTHTFSHYYCLEPGQKLPEFEEDLKAAKKIAAKNNVDIESIVFPRNQCNHEYLGVCNTLGVKSYRGNEKNWAFESSGKSLGKLGKFLRKIARGMDAYLNLFGHHCYTWEAVSKRKENEPYNIPSSRLFRAYSKKMQLLEPLKINRIKRSMKHAAKKNRIYHLWWHPHNFGSNIEENFRNLESILRYHDKLKLKYGFTSNSMESMVALIEKNGANQN